MTHDDDLAAKHVGPEADAVVVVAPWSPASADRAADGSDIEAIFFEASGTKVFASEEIRAAFRARWLGRYLSAPDAIVLVARIAAAARISRISGTPIDTRAIQTPDSADRIVGYVIGTLSDPARDHRFDDIAYFQDLCRLTARFPAHLHINCAPEWRSRGVGAALIEAFCRAARSGGAGGVHVVTGAGLRNTRFYARNGFHEVGRAQSNGHPVVMLGRVLG